MFFAVRSLGRWQLLVLVVWAVCRFWIRQVPKYLMAVDADVVMVVATVAVVDSGAGDFERGPVGFFVVAELVKIVAPPSHFDGDARID